MLENRDYMREPGYNPSGFRWSATTILMATLVGVFALQAINDAYLGWSIDERFGLTNQAILSGYAWQFLTFQFLHGSLFHLLGNLLTLWFFGRFVEDVL